jgi:hypothetical protein
MKFNAANHPSRTSSPSASASSSKPVKLGTGSIVGAVVGGIIFLIAIGIAFLLYRRKKNRQLQAMAELVRPPAEFQFPLPIYGHGTADCSVPPTTSAPFYGAIDEG